MSSDMEDHGTRCREQNSIGLHNDVGPIQVYYIIKYIILAEC